MVPVERQREIEERLSAITKELCDISDELGYTVDIMASHTPSRGASPAVFVHPNDSCYSVHRFSEIKGLLFAAEEATTGGYWE